VLAAWCAALCGPYRGGVGIRTTRFQASRDITAIAESARFASPRKIASCSARSSRSWLTPLPEQTFCNFQSLQIDVDDCFPDLRRDGAKVGFGASGRVPAVEAERLLCDEKEDYRPKAPQRARRADSGYSATEPRVASG